MLISMNGKISRYQNVSVRPELVEGLLKDFFIHVLLSKKGQQCC
jgi:hypothetical protein